MKNKIEGTPILKLAMVKDYRSKKKSFEKLKKSSKNLRQNFRIHTVGTRMYPRLHAIGELKKFLPTYKIKFIRT